jgi:hypothetical protein
MTLTKYSDFQEIFKDCIAYYPGQLNSDGKLADVVGGYHGTIISATRIGTDRFEMANKTMVFDGSGSITIGDISALKTSAFTIAVWFNLNQFGYSYQSLLSCQTYGNHNDYAFFYGDYDKISKLVFTTQTTSTGYSISESITRISLNNWYMGTCTFTNNGLCYLYINNNEISSNTMSITYSSSNVSIGKLVSSPSGFHGNIGEVFYFDRQLTAAQVQTLYSLTKPRYVPLLLSGNRGIY